MNNIPKPALIGGGLVLLLIVIVVVMRMQGSAGGNTTNDSVSQAAKEISNTRPNAPRMAPEQAIGDAMTRKGKR